MISDVRGSTKATKQGRYQDVNTLGAASVAVLGNLWQQDDVPFVFGGDGASLLIAQNQSIELAKFAVANSKSIAFIRGGGLSWADNKIKSEPDRYCLKDESAGVLAELVGLSCRLQPLKSRKGLVLTLLVRSKKNDVVIFSEILEELTAILGGDVQLSSPVNAKNMNYKSLWQTIKSKFKYHAAHLDRAYLKRLFWASFSVWSIKNDRVKPFNAKRYRQSIPGHSDFRKFGDMLRLVLDCSPEQIQKIRTYLETLYRDGKIFFGLHESDHAIITCLVETVDDGQHIHFIDGGAGGYAMAAKPLKEQMSLSHSSGGTVQVQNDESREARG